MDRTEQEQKSHSNLSFLIQDWGPGFFNTKLGTGFINNKQQTR